MEMAFTMLPTTEAHAATPVSAARYGLKYWLPRRYKKEYEKL